MTSALLLAHGIQMIHVMPGYKCNLYCTHCGNNSGPNASDALNTDELNSLSRCMSLHSPRKLLFTGGEPTLYIDIINQIISAHADKDNLIVQITSNGWYAKGGRKLILKVLQKIEQLNHLQLSYDVFHGSLLNFEDIKMISQK